MPANPFFQSPDNNNLAHAILNMSGNNKKEDKPFVFSKVVKSRDVNSKKNAKSSVSPSPFANF
jgi:hypothetical protein